MAKIRVYELARELNIKNKALLEKLEDMDISVSSHMSSLDRKAVKKVKAEILGKKAADKMEVTRVKKTVIRRRKKREEEIDETVEAENASPEEIEETEPVEAEAAENVEAAPAEAEAPAETDAPPAEEETTVEAPPAEPEKEAPAKPKRPKEAAARIIKKPAPPEPEPTSPDAVPEETAAAPPPEPVADEEEPKEEAKEEPTEPAEITTDANEPAETAPAEETPSEAETAEAAEADESESATAAAEKKGKKKKKTKKDMPAKIIKLPPKVETESDSPDDNEDAQADEDAADKGAPDAADAAGKAKAKKKKFKPEDETRWAKKKISFRRKEVVEGDALYSRSGRGRKKKKGGKAAAATPSQKPQITVPKAIKRRIKIDDTIVLSDLAKRMGIKANEMIKKLMMLGVMATVNQTIDFDTAALVAAEFGYEVEKAVFEEETVLMQTETEDDPEKMSHRPPVVTIMGHVDHGKTSLLDMIRKTRVTEDEAGGITQHIGAYSVSTPGGQITFLDTPGHEAFTSMRARGATVTDIVVLVVAADDGVMPQTIEAINHSRAASVPIIVAVNKMDKAGADPDRVMRELSDKGLVPEDWGGDTIFVKVSAKKNTGIDELLEMILLQSEILELKANPDKNARGYVVESKLDSGRGPVATVLVQEGTLNNGDTIVCGVHYGKVRAMLNDLGAAVDKAGPAIPVEVLGLSGVPNSGDELIALDDEKSAKQISEHRLQKQRSKELAQTSRMSLDKLFERMKEEEVKELNIILKADVHGSIEALTDSLTKLSNEEVTIRVIHSATGTVSESDISLAAVSDAIIIGFNVRPSPKIQSMATEEQVDMRFYNIIYNVIKDVKDAIVGMMESKYEERTLGQAEIREVFHVPKVGAIAGCYVTDGKIQRGREIRLVRDGVVIHEGKIGSLRRFKDDVKEVLTGYECGIGIEKYNDIKVGDVIECFYMEEIKPELE